MLGIIFEAVRETITKEHGEDTWDALLDDADVDGAYSRLGNYPMQELQAIVEAASKTLGAPPEQIWQSVGAKAFEPLAANLPDGLSEFSSSRDLFRSLEGVIHRRVTTVHPDANPPSFEYSEEGDVMTLSYSSRRKLCHLATGLAEGAVAAFGEQADVAQIECGVQTGGPCRIQLTYQT